MDRFRVEVISSTPNPQQSFRFTGSRIVNVAEGKADVEDVFYLRPVGAYTDRQGKKYEYTKDVRQQDLDWCIEGSKRYKQRIDQGFSEEHARGLIPFDVRQHWVLSANARSLMHLLDLRWKADAQLEAQKLCEAIWPKFQAWVPAIASWYEDNRLKKARLSPKRCLLKCSVNYMHIPLYLVKNVRSDVV